MLLGMNFDCREAKIEVREHFFCVSWRRVSWALFFKGDNKCLSSGFNFNLTPCFFLEISLNSCLIYTARPAFYGVNGQSSTKICFKYNVFDIIHCVFFCGSVDQKITRKAGSSSSSFGWFVFFSFFFRCCCIVLFVFFLYNFCLFVCFFFIPTAHQRFCDTRISRY